MVRIACFGETERGEFQAVYYCQSAWELADYFGGPPHQECQGLSLAIQALLYEWEVIFIRVREEGFSTSDYLYGLSLLQERERIPPLSALCLPGVGSREIIEATTPVCALHNSFLLFTDRDLFDYLTER